MSAMPIKIIISASAGSGDNNEAVRRLAQIFDEKQVEAEISLAQNGAEVAELAREAALGPYKVIVAGGGDGTVSSIAAAVINSGKILGVLPLGTLNHFARDLKIPFDLEA